MNLFLKIIFFICFVIISPIIFFSMLFIFIEDGSPIIFKQKRVGKYKKNIYIYKIRTMKNETPNLGTHQISKSNYLMFGSFIRMLKIDELPQIINFIKGDIELVGPRPCLPNQHKLIQERDAFNIYSIKPGITGLAQVLGYDMSNPKKLAYVDGVYLQNKSSKLDLMIFCSTFFIFLRKSLRKNFELELSNKFNNKNHV